MVWGWGRGRGRELMDRREIMNQSDPIGQFLVDHLESQTKLTLAQERISYVFKKQHKFTVSD